jgi:hypothetical protein
MTNKLSQAAQAALDALVQIDRVAPGPMGRNAMRVLREAIEQARTMEPVACMVQTDTGLMLWPIEDYKEAENYCEEDEFPEYLYTRPTPAKPAQPLTAEQVFKAIEHGDTEHRAWLRAALYALWDGLPVPAQYDQQALELCTKCGWKALIPGDGCLNCERVAQPAKPLTEEQIMQIPEYWTADGMGGLILFARAVEAAHGIKGQA